MFHGKANFEQGTHEPSITFKTEKDAALQQEWEMQVYLAAVNISSIVGQSLLTSFQKKATNIRVQYIPDPEYEYHPGLQ